jgi:hypothetical protein
MSRPHGSKNRKTQAREHARAVLNMPDATPLEFLLAIMRSDEFPLAMRKDAALGAAHFVHPRLQAVMHSTVPDNATMLGELIEELDGTARGLPHYDDADSEAADDILGAQGGGETLE